MVSDLPVYAESKYAQRLTKTQLEMLVKEARQTRAKYAYTLIRQGRLKTQARFSRLKAALNAVMAAQTRRIKFLKGH